MPDQEDRIISSGNSGNLFLIPSLCFNVLLFKNFNELRDNALKKIKDHSDFDILPKKRMIRTNSETGNFVNESVAIKEIDYYFSNSIARSSKTMSDCRTARSKNLKNQTGT